MITTAFAILLAIAAFLCGGFLTAITFIVAFTGDVKVLKRDVSAMKGDLERYCTHQSKLERQVERIDTTQRLKMRAEESNT